MCVWSYGTDTTVHRARSSLPPEMGVFLTNQFILSHILTIFKRLKIFFVALAKNVALW